MVYQQPRGGRYLETKESAFRQESLPAIRGFPASARLQLTVGETPKKPFHTGILRELKRDGSKGLTVALSERHLRVPGKKEPL